jgi:hypothetical protein
MLIGSEVRVVSCCKCVLHQGLAITVAKVRVRRDLLMLGVERELQCCRQPTRQYPIRHPELLHLLRRH